MNLTAPIPQNTSRRGVSGFRAFCPETLCTTSPLLPERYQISELERPLRNGFSRHRVALYTLGEGTDSFGIELTVFAELQYL